MGCSKHSILSSSGKYSCDITPHSDKFEFKEIKEKEILKLFKEAKNRISINSRVAFGQDLPSIIKNKLISQEKMLNFTHKFLKEENLLFKRIEHKINRSHSELLMNKSIEYRKKKEERDSHSIDGNIDRYLWILSLRKSKFSNDKNYTFLNVGLPHKPNFQYISESIIKPKIEKIRHPCNSSDNKALFFEGKNVIEEEIERINKMNGRKYLFKDKEKRTSSQDDLNYLKYNTFKKSFRINKQKR